MRVRPYVSLPDPGEPDDDAPPPPIPRVVTPPPQHDTPAYGIPVTPAHQPWPEGGQDWQGGHAAHPAETAQLRAIPEEGPEKRTGPAFRRLLPLLIAGAAVVALGGTAAALWVLPDSAGNDTALMDAKASAPVTSLAPAGPSQTPAATATSSPSPSASPSASKSPSPSPSASRSSAPPSPSASPSTSRAPSPTPPAAAPTLRYGDSGAEVEKLQRLLAARGLFTYKINGKFDWRVENAVSTFQYDNGIDEEWGVYGPLTRKALEG
ncbi:peptidoglycan-binding protein [Streptomyces sp. ISL-44]|uniref:peptidoglycan-binding domain-containing protein n=1 Tax=Streptomyces sp. ISL-44 TaxID=2819184 RepID=UPI001BE8DAA2|nr:peptidoglycan-binding domain-containing protein [Streptomyces sp. ISL-44]MBT2540654.1 peptidoglycan-binding protein [Streptomyces sp. ISL-44]